MDKARLLELVCLRSTHLRNARAAHQARRASFVEQH